MDDLAAAGVDADVARRGAVVEDQVADLQVALGDPLPEWNC
jgi:hypothetical protein